MKSGCNDTADSPRGRRHWNGSLAIAFTCLFCTLVANILDQSVNAQLPETEKQLAAMWERQKSEIVTGSIRVRLYRYLEVPALSLTRDRFNSQLRSIDLGEPEKSLEGLRSSLRDGSIGYWGTPVEIIVEGSKVRNNIQPGDTPSDGPAEVHVFNGEEQVAISRANQQASIYAGRSSLHIIKLTDLRFVPRSPDKLQVVEESQDRVTLRGPGSEIVADRQTGFVHQYTVNNPHDGEASAVTREITQLGPTAYSDGIIFPTVTINAKYEGGAVTMFSVYLIERAEFNLELPKDAFVAAAPERTQIVNYRENPSAPSQHVISEDVLDVIDTANRVPAGNGVGRATNRWVMLLSSAAVLAGVVAVLFGIRLLRRRTTTI